MLDIREATTQETTVFLGRWGDIEFNDPSRMYAMGVVLKAFHGTNKVNVSFQCRNNEEHQFTAVAFLEELQALGYRFSYLIDGFVFTLEIK